MLLDYANTTFKWKKVYQFEVHRSLQFSHHLQGDHDDQFLNFPFFWPRPIIQCLQYIILNIKHKYKLNHYIKTNTTFVKVFTKPLMTFPKTQCLPSSHGVLTVVIKNCEPFVSGPALAILRSPGPVCLSIKFSSGNLSP